MPIHVDTEAHVLDLQKHPFISNVNGIDITGQATLDARWQRFQQATENSFANGLLVRKGDITLINPDKTSAIAALNIQIDERIHFSHDEQNVHESDIIISGYPRISSSLDNKGNGSFRDVMNTEIPDGDFNRKRSVSFPISYLGSGHHEFFKDKTGVDIGSGLPIIRINNRRADRTVTAPLEQIKKSPALSKDPKIREAICSYIELAIKGQLGAKQFEGPNVRRLAVSGGGPDSSIAAHR